MLRFLFFFSSAFSAFSQDEQLSPACVMPLSSRRDAWDGIFPIGDCEKLGHCWAAAPRNLPQIPWCFHRAEQDGIATQEACAAAAAGSRRECAGVGNITPRSCSEKGCCWAAGDGDEPWCFWPAGEGYSIAEEMAAWDEDADDYEDL
jgi:hypothetical protein